MALTTLIPVALLVTALVLGSIAMSSPEWMHLEVQGIETGVTVGPFRAQADLGPLGTYDGDSKEIYDAFCTVPDSYEGEVEPNDDCNRYAAGMYGSRVVGVIFMLNILGAVYKFWTIPPNITTSPAFVAQAEKGCISLAVVGTTLTCVFVYLMADALIGDADQAVDAVVDSGMTLMIIAGVLTLASGVAFRFLMNHEEKMERLRRKEEFQNGAAAPRVVQAAPSARVAPAAVVTMPYSSAAVAPAAAPVAVTASAAAAAVTTQPVGQVQYVSVLGPNGQQMLVPLAALGGAVPLTASVPAATQHQ